jgi:hypothetical protein
VHWTSKPNRKSNHGQLLIRHYSLQCLQLLLGSEKTASLKISTGCTLLEELILQMSFEETNTTFVSVDGREVTYNLSIIYK